MRKTRTSTIVGMTFMWLIVLFALMCAFVVTVKASTLTKRGGVNYYKGTKETWYNLDMTRIYAKADANFGKHHKKWTREDGVKMYGPYVVLAVPFDVYPYGTTDIPTSLGLGIALDTGKFAETNKDQPHECHSDNG